MLKFFNDYEKVNKLDNQNNQNKPTTVTVKAPDNSIAGTTAEAAPAMTVDDMKAYFDSMRDSLIKEIKEQLQPAPNNDNREKEGDNNASNTDL